MKIIRTRQRPFLVVIDVILTVLAWVGLLFLLVRGLWPLIETSGGPRIDHSAFDALGTLQVYMWVALVNAVILIGWARYQQRKSRSFAQRRLPSPVIGDEGLSKSFAVRRAFPETAHAGVMTIHNDQDGDISHVETHLWPLQQQALPAPLAPWSIHG